MYALTGTAAFAVGVVVYLTDRAPHHPALLFGAAGQWLPSFIHVFAFSLFTAAASARRDAPNYGACVGWWAVNVAFECGQHPSLHWVRGTFDPADIAAATLGAISAALVLRTFHRMEERRVD